MYINLYVYEKSRQRKLTHSRRGSEGAGTNNYFTTTGPLRWKVFICGRKYLKSCFVETIREYSLRVMFRKLIIRRLNCKAFISIPWKAALGKFLLAMNYISSPNGHNMT